MIEVKNLSFYYKRNKLVLDDIDCMFRKGRIYGLLGKNGVGKTTLLHLIAGLKFPKLGNVTINLSYNANGIENEISYTPQERKVEFLQDVFFLNEEMPESDFTIEQMEKYNACFYPNFSAEDFNNYLQEFEIDNKKQELKKLSFGTKKKVYIAFGLACNTKLIFLDEPTNGLDIPSKSSFRKIVMKAMTEEKTIIISTHQARDLQNVLDSIVILDKTKVLLNADAEEITKKLWFGIEEKVSVADKVLYQEDNVAGLAIVRENKGEEESNLDVEMLFNAAFLNKNLFNELFNNKK
ncbi:MAG: ABC transporter ATP-binding protein [Bacteroidales bacterium]|nr:ABC transporter ATP-binding protein [Bacteroidales bacterium]MBQ9313239.1 ABC transporter ATP-binding protein [Bacteroidales bacterium]